MQARLYNDLTRGALSDALGGGDFAFPKLTQNDDITLTLRFAEKVDGAWSQVPRDVRSLRAAIGKLDARPTSGTWKLRAAPHGETKVATTALAYNATADQLKAALVALANGIESSALTVVTENGSWLIFSTARLDLAPGQNLLRPLAFVVIDEDERADGTWLYEVRLTQSPAAFVDQFERVLPPPPVVKPVQDGQDVDGIVVPEVQALEIPVWFSGIIRLKRGSRVTAELSTADDGPEQFQAAMQAALWTDEEIENGAEFEVELVADNLMHIRFVGGVVGQDFPLLEIEVVDAPEGDVQFTLSLKTAAIRDLLRAEAEPKAELSILYEVADATAEISENEPVRLVTGYKGTVTLVRSLIAPDMGADQNIPWLQPETPKDFKVFSRNQVIFATRNAARALDAGLEHEWEHGLGSDAVTSLIIRENTAGGRVLRDNEYTWTIDGTDSVTITLDESLAPVAADQYAAVLQVAGPEEHFLAHTHTMDDNPWAAPLFADIAARLAALEAKAPTIKLTESTASSGIVWPLPDVASVLPARDLVRGITLPAFTVTTAATDLASVLRRGMLYPALHDAAAEDMPASLGSPANPARFGKVYENVWPKAKSGIPSGAFCATNGRRWYEVVQSMADLDPETGKGDWFPAAMKLDLWKVGVNERQLPVGTVLRATWGFDAALIRAKTAAQWVLVVEYGGIREGEEFTGDNVEAVDWAVDKPLMRQRIVLTDVPQRHDFGLRLARPKKDVSPFWEFKVNGIYYGRSEVEENLPAGIPFALRSRLVEWDTENSKPATGYVVLSGLGTAADNGAAAIPAEITIS